METKRYCEVSELLGKTLQFVEIDWDEHEIVFKTDDQTYIMFHDQDCCESVTIEDICGDMNDLLGEPLTTAEEVDNTVGEVAAKINGDSSDDSYTWTFYRFATRKGLVSIRWYGVSNGYYSESVDFAEITEEGARD